MTQLRQCPVKMIVNKLFQGLQAVGSATKNTNSTMLVIRNGGNNDERLTGYLLKI